MQLERWLKFSRTQQMGAIAAEIMRAKTWEGKEKDNFLSALERALQLIDLTFEDKRWKERLTILFRLRDETAKFYIGLNKNSIEVLYNAL